MDTSYKWLVAVLVISVVIMAIMIVLLFYLFSGDMDSGSIMQSVFTGFMFGKMLMM